MDNLSLQRKIFALVLDRFPKRSAAVSYLAGLLSLGNNAIYRRLRGDTLLTLGELYQVAHHFGFSLDNIFFEKTDKIIFSYSFFTRRVSSFDAYIDQAFENVQKLSKMPNARVYYSSQEIPFFIYFASPLLFAFKMYIYAVTYWNFDHLQDQKFSSRLIPDSLSKRARKISDIYNLLPSTELWSVGLIDHTLNQIEYMATINKFEEPGDALLVCEAVRESMNHARQMAEKGQKFSQNVNNGKPGQQLTLYCNGFYPTNDTILVISDNEKIVYTTFGTPNFLTTIDDKICTQVEEWFNFIVSRSTSITIHSGKERNKFFNGLEKRIDQTQKKIKELIEE